MADKDIKQAIQDAIKAFAAGDLTDNALKLFRALGYGSERRVPLSPRNYHQFQANFIKDSGNFNEDKALVKDWVSVDMLFQLTRDELTDQESLFKDAKVDDRIIESYLFFAIELKKEHYNRTILSQITREVNKAFKMPAMILFKYGGNITIAVINRRLHKKDEQKDVLLKVTVIKDISIEKPHRAHVEILFDLSWGQQQAVHKCTNFVELHDAWQKTLDTKELNKRFYRELSSWYFWAIRNVSFPNDIKTSKDDTVFNSENVIRMLTRLIFIWFIKEKNLIPEAIFDEKEVSKLLKGFKGKKSTVYYRAILQNLFFATLNQKREERKFAQEGSFLRNQKQYGIKTLYRYADDFNIDEKDVRKLFESVPFLNGGLFDCLDSTDKDGKVMYHDGFSRNPARQAKVPDELFFSEEQIVDLSKVYDDSRKKNEKVKGLFSIFNNYKFTIAENTPIEEEVALDPELLGRVFENLLASYNPETQTTARKATGSFYTPREIVSYMVDESLMAHLKQKLETEAGMTPEDAETGLRFVIGYYEKGNPFTPKETEILISAIDNCKILDPACGSGAFPMGMLHKLVHVLHKLDPNNELWKKRQIKKAREIDDSEIRDNLVSDIETAFENNELDYGRKLYLIENCIYGVDIQPIATQISKLRFFISLVVDQNVNKDTDNFGIRPLPNLETKFVAANTLIGVEKPEVQMGLFENKKLEELEDNLKEVRHRIFSAKTASAKKKLHEEDLKLREKIAKELEDEGWSNEAAGQLAGWDPYNQNASSPFFDPEWMFGIKDGFDIVIGNPPYQGFRDMPMTLKKAIQANYKTAIGKYDLYVPFIEIGLELLKDNACLIYICPTAFAKRDYGKALRHHLLATSQPVKLVDFEHDQIFGEATNYTGIVTIRNKVHDKAEKLQYKQGLDGNTINIPLTLLNDNAWIFVSDKKQELIERLKHNTVPLDTITNISEGIVTGFNKLYLKSKEEIADKFEKQFFYPCLRGKDISAFFHDACQEYVFYPYISSGGRTIPIKESVLKEKNNTYYNYLKEYKKEIMAREYFATSSKSWYELWNQRKMDNFKNIKIVTPELSEKNRFAIASENVFYGDTVCGIMPLDSNGNDNFLYFLLGLLNSQLIEWYYKTTTVPKAGGFFIYKVMFLRNLPIRIPSQDIQNEIANKVRFCIKSLQEGQVLEIEKMKRGINSLVNKCYDIDSNEIDNFEKR